MAATGLPEPTKSLTSATASASFRSASGLATPPGSTRATKSSTFASATVTSTARVSALSRCSNSWTVPLSGLTRTGSYPASATASHGSTSSACSMPSAATRNAIFSLFAMLEI